MKLEQILELEETPELKSKYFTFFLNSQPIASWLKPHPSAKVKDANGNNTAAMYMPIDKVDFLLDKIYLKSKLEVIRYSLEANSMCVHVRLHVLNPVTKEWDCNDGLGASPLQTDKDKGACDFDFLKNSSVQMALPSALSYAKKDAAEQFGRIFGRDLNKNNIATYEEPKKFENPKMTEK